VDRQDHQDRHRDADRHQDRLHRVRHQDHQDVRHQDHQVRRDEDQNQDVGHQDRQGRRDHVGHQDLDGNRQDHRDVRHQDQVEHRDHQDDRQDLDGNRLDLDVTYQVPCADQVVVECADLWRTQDQEVVGLVDDLQGDAHQEACREAFQLAAYPEATGHVQRGALGVSLEAD
jgi:hypothetical protein